MTLRLNGSTSGYVEIDAPATAGSNTLVLPNGNGTNGQYLQTNGSGTLSWSTSGLPAQVLTLGTSVASTSGTAIDFTGIPSTVKRVTVMFNGVSTNGTSVMLVQAGTSAGIVSSGYLSHSGYIQGGAVGSNTATSGLCIVSGTATDLLYGPLTLATTGANTWMASGALFRDSGTDYSIISTGVVTLSGTLDRVRITSSNGTDTFDAGSINIMYEG